MTRMSSKGSEKLCRLLVSVILFFMPTSWPVRFVNTTLFSLARVTYAGLYSVGRKSSLLSASESVWLMRTTTGIWYCLPSRAHAPRTAQIVRCWLIPSRAEGYDPPGTVPFTEENRAPLFATLPTPAAGYRRPVAPQALPYAEGPAAAPPAAAPLAGHRRHRPVRRHRRGPGLAGDRDLRPQAPRLAEALPGAAPRHPLARHLRARLRPPQPAGVPGLLPRVGPGRQRGLADSARGHRRQDLARLRVGEAGPAAPGQCLGHRAAAVAGPGGGGRQVQRDHSHPRAAGAAGRQGRAGDHRRDGLPEGHRAEGRGRGRALHPDRQGQPGAPARGHPGSARGGVRRRLRRAGA